MEKELDTIECLLSTGVCEIEHTIGVVCPEELFAGLGGAVCRRDERIYFANDIARPTAEKYVIGTMRDERSTTWSVLLKRAGNPRSARGRAWTHSLWPVC